MAAIFLILVMIFSLAACGGGGGGQKVSTTINVFNWGDYIDESVLTDFEKEYGIKVNYDYFATNEEMYVKLKSGGTDYDVLFPSDYMIARLIKEDMLHKLDFNNIPNIEHIDDRFKNLDYDPNNEYSVPYMWGTVGIAYNTTMVDEPVDSWNILWDPKYEGNILMMDSQRDSIAVALKKLGYSLNSRNEAELEQAKEELIKQKPLVLSYVGDEVKDKMIGGEAALAVVYSGEVIAIRWENPDIAYSIPKEGSNLWFDAMVIPKTSQNKEAAEKFIDFMTRPEIAVRNAEYVGYSIPNTTAIEMLDEELRNDEVAYPDLDSLDNCEVFEDVSDVIEVYNRIWDQVKAAH
ncbi:MAG: spermidine/putrescine ABC transporter substrate-binding protein [Clostridiales bacterium]|jgi:spermidine/putrescine transport system substrate-binding protein|nr:spermidine/putrescine ABC transporter substrate-binding protein [Clostridiales bacterium]